MGFKNAGFPKLGFNPMGFSQMIGAGAPSAPYIGDVITMTNAYSLRKLYASSTKAIRVKRTDTAEMDIGFAGVPYIVDDGVNQFLVEDLDEVALLAFVGVGDGTIIGYYNQKDNGATENYEQVNQSLQPMIVSSGVIVRSGARASIDYYPASIPKELDSLMTLVQPFVICKVLQSVSLGNRWSIRNPLDFNFVMGQSISFWRMQGFFTTEPSTLNLTAFSGFFNGTSSESGVNTVYEAASASGDATNPSLGKGWRGTISEMIILPDNTQKQDIVNNQIAYYSIV